MEAAQAVEERDVVGLPGDAADPSVHRGVVADALAEGTVRDGVGVAGQMRPREEKAVPDDSDTACDPRKTLVGTTGFEPATP
ncbi:hypothetical protein [Streptomyces sp. NPDC088789]|uniref:hypothetical protein n=1 Tax=Streptomyces sp. NPDC088789 TaxID=3365899 RepID=UPI003816C49F